MGVNSGTKVALLNADELDGLEPSQIKGAKAYAVVDPDGGPGSTPVLASDLTSGFTSVERVGAGQYCLNAPGLNPTSRPAVVSVEWASTDVPEANASALPVTGGCFDGRFLVVTERTVLSDGVLTDDVANNVGFVIAVP